MPLDIAPLDRELAEVFAAALLVNLRTAAAYLVPGRKRLKTLWYNVLGVITARNLRKHSVNTLGRKILTLFAGHTRGFLLFSVP